ncbi:MAG TPA: hypothetical protein VGB87_05450 [Vicinamibacteria bacterium]
MQRLMAGLGLILLLAGAGRADAGGLDLRMGGFFPRMRDCGVAAENPEYTLFRDVCDLYLIGKGDFDGVYGGVEYNQVVLDYVELGVHYDYYSNTEDTSYRDYTRPDDSEIRQSLRLRVAPLGVTVRFLPTAKRHRIVPFVGGGVDALFYKYEEVGDFIDFQDPDLAILPDAFVAEDTAFGYHALGGLRVYVNRDFAVVGEGRYQWGKHDMGDDFAPNEPGLVNTIDLGGWTFTVGLHVRF